MQLLSMIIGGDMVPTKTNESLFVDGNIESIVGSNLLTLLRSVDYRIFNLEAPLVDTLKPIKKKWSQCCCPHSHD